MGLKKKINILFIIDELLGFGGGTENHLATVLEHIDKDKFNPFVCTFSTDYRCVFERINKSCSGFIYFPVRRIYTVNALIQALKLFNFIKANRIDVVQTFLFKADIYGTLIARIAGVPVIISSRRDMGDLRKKRQLLAYKFVNKLVHRFIAVCNSVRDVLVNVEGIPESKITTIYNGVDLKRFNLNFKSDDKLRRKLNISNEAFVIGNISHFRPEKDHKTFFDAIKEVKSHIRDFKVVTLGDGPLEDYYKEYCNRIGIIENVIFNGSVTEVVPFISIMDIICIVPNKNEGLSNAIMEGMAMGKPIIGTCVGGNSELIVDGKTGFIIKPNDSENLAKLIIALYENPILRANMGNEGRLRIQRNFNVTRMVTEMESLYIKAFRMREE